MTVWDYAKLSGRPYDTCKKIVRKHGLGTRKVDGIGNVHIDLTDGEVQFLDGTRRKSKETKSERTGM